MGFHTTQDILILKELKRRAATFAADYDPDLPTVILVPGGMGSRLLKTREAVEPGDPFPEQPTFDQPLPAETAENALSSEPGRCAVETPATSARRRTHPRVAGKCSRQNRCRAKSLESRSRS